MQWSLPTSWPAITQEEVHVWRTDLPRLTSGYAEMYLLLAHDEKARAAKFRFEAHRTEFVLGRGILRCILGCYLDIPPQDLTLIYNSFGKPALASGAFPIKFNLSHSGSMAVYAFTLGRRVGVDIEFFKRDFAWEPLVENCFSSDESLELYSLPPELRLVAFLNGWTRKEAYLKARGEGLSTPLNQCEVTLQTGHATLRIPSEAQNWCLKELGIGRDYVGALAVEGYDWRLKLWEWPNSGL